MPPPRKAPVTARALLMRLNRALAARRETIRRCRPSSPIRATLGAYYRLSLKQNTVLATHIDLEALARELGVLRPYEQLAPEE